MYAREKFRRVAPPGEDYLIRRIEALEREVAVVRSARKIETASAFAENNSTSIPTTFTNLGYASVPVPPTFLGGHYSMMVSAGDSFTAASNLTVQPFLQYVGPGGTSTYYGPAINSGNNTIAVAVSFWASNFWISPDPTIAATELRLGVAAIRAGTSTEVSPTSGNWHLSGSVIFKRGG